MMEFQRYPADVVFPGCMMSDVRRFQIGRGDFGKVDDVEAKVRELVDHLQVPGGVALRAAVGERPLHRGELQAARQRHHHQHPPQHHRAEGARGVARRRQGGGRGGARRRRAHAAVDADRARQHERGRSALRQGLPHRVRQPQALRIPRLSARDRRARRLRLRRHPLHGQARRLWPRRRRREGRSGARRAHSRSEAAAATCGAPATAAWSSSRSIRCPTAACSRSATTSPRSSTAKRRCARRPTSSS